MTQSLEIKDSESAIIIVFHIKIKTLEMKGKIVLHREIQKKKNIRNILEILELEKYNVSNKKIFVGSVAECRWSKKVSELKDRSIILIQSEQQKKEMPRVEP